MADAFEELNSVRAGRGREPGRCYQRLGPGSGSHGPAEGPDHLGVGCRQDASKSSTVTLAAVGR